MLQMEPIIARYRANTQTQALSNELMEYQQLKQQAAQIEDRLEELCSAIEDFGLACASNITQDERVIYCRTQSYTPRALLAQARTESDLLEQTTAQMAAARGRVLSKILHETNNMAEYRAIRWACVDLHEQAGFQLPPNEPDHLQT